MALSLSRFAQGQAVCCDFGRRESFIEHQVVDEGFTFTVLGLRGLLRPFNNTLGNFLKDSITVRDLSIVFRRQVLTKR